MHVRAYLRASTKEQDATRAKDDLTAFAKPIIGCRVWSRVWTALRWQGFI